MNSIVLQSHSMADLWRDYVTYALQGQLGQDDGVQIRECFWVNLHFLPQADFIRMHPAMNLKVQAQYIRKMTTTDIDPELGGSYGYRLRCSYGIDQLSLIANKLAAKPTTKSACANLLHPNNSSIEIDAGMQRTACMTNLQALLRDGSLHLSAHFRSQNVWNSHGNFMALYHLQRDLIDSLSQRGLIVNVGSIVVFVAAAHLYESDIDAATALSQSP